MDLFVSAFVLFVFVALQKVYSSSIQLSTIRVINEPIDLIKDAIDRNNNGTLEIGYFTRSIMKALVIEDRSSCDYQTFLPLHEITQILLNDIHENCIDWDSTIDQAFNRFHVFNRASAIRAIEKHLVPAYPILTVQQLTSLRGPGYERALNKLVMDTFHSRLLTLVNSEYSDQVEYEYEKLLFEARYSMFGKTSDFTYHTAFLKNIKLKNFKKEHIPPVTSTSSLEQYLYVLAKQQFNVLDRKITDVALINMHSIAYDRSEDPDNYDKFITECKKCEIDSTVEVPLSSIVADFSRKLEALSCNEESQRNLKQVISTILTIANDPVLKRVVILSSLYFEIDGFGSYWDEGSHRSAAFIAVSMLNQLYPREAQIIRQRIGINHSLEDFLFGQDLSELGFLQKIISYRHIRTIMEITKDQETIPSELLESALESLTFSSTKIIHMKCAAPLVIDQNFERCINDCAFSSRPGFAKFLLNLIERNNSALKELIQRSLLEALYEESETYVSMILEEGFEIDSDFAIQMLELILENELYGIAELFFRKFPNLPDSSLNSILNMDDYSLSSALEIALLKPNLSDEWLKTALSSIRDEEAINVIRRERPDLFIRFQKRRIQ